MLNEVKHLAIEREILRCAQNDTPYFICDEPLVLIGNYPWLFRLLLSTDDG